MADDNLTTHQDTAPENVKPQEATRQTEVRTERSGGVTETAITVQENDRADPPESRTSNSATSGSSTSFRETTPDPEQKPAADSKAVAAAWASRQVSFDKDATRVGGAALTVLLVGLLFVAIGAWDKWVSALMWAGACSAVGWFLGFLFGIPRTLSTEGQSEAITQTATELPAGDTKTQVRARRTTGVNTNLEQISDWLTKILVGVTLVQLDDSAARLEAAATVIASSLGGAGNTSFAYALMIYFTLIGFLGSYLLTRLFLQRALQEAANGE